MINTDKYEGHSTEYSYEIVSVDDDKEMDAYGKMMSMMEDEPMEFFGDEDDEGMVILILNKHDM